MGFGNDVKISSEAEYNAAVAEVERLFGMPQSTPDGKRFALLASLVEVYEQEHYAIDAPSEQAAQRYHLEKQGMGTAA